MQIVKVGLNYKSAPVEIREKLTFSENSIQEAMISLQSRRSILENVIISTCNRTEIYAVVEQESSGMSDIHTFLAEWFSIEEDEFAGHLQYLMNDSVLEHLCRVTVGLESMILGETQILGQVRDAFLNAQQVRTTGAVFNELFKRAITFAKRMHHQTGINDHAISVGYTTVELAKKFFDNIKDMRVTIIGAGKMSELIVQNLCGGGVTDITIVNRTYSKGKALATTYGVKSEQLTNLSKVLETTDIFITSTGAVNFIVAKENLEPIMSNRLEQTLLIVDISVPRNVDPEIRTLRNVVLYDIDDLQHIVDENIEERKKAAHEIEKFLNVELKEFKEWLSIQDVVPVIAALQRKAEQIQTQTMKSIESKIPHLTEREKKVISKHTTSIINQLLKQPINQVKEIASSEHLEEDLQLFVNIFGIEREDIYK